MRIEVLSTAVLTVGGHYTNPTTVVSSAIGANPVALLIPCLWVIKQSGAQGINQEAYSTNLEKMRDASVAL